MTAIIALPLAGDVERALERLKSLHDGDLGVVDITGCGSRAVLALRALLLTGETSSIYQPRCRAVAALAALGAHHVIIEFLGSPREVADPINRSGEEAVVNAAARALIGVKDPRIFPLLLELAETRLSAGVVEALGSFGRTAALPALLRAMREDHTRPAAEAALLRLNVAACPALAEIATRPLPSPGQESPSSRRTRLGATRILARIGASEKLFRPVDRRRRSGNRCRFLHGAARHRRVDRRTRYVAAADRIAAAPLLDRLPRCRGMPFPAFRAGAGDRWPAVTGWDS
jgi:HEAT repeats